MRTQNLDQTATALRGLALIFMAFGLLIGAYYVIAADSWALGAAVALGTVAYSFPLILAGELIHLLVDISKGVGETRSLVQGLASRPARPAPKPKPQTSAPSSSPLSGAPPPRKIAPVAQSEGQVCGNCGNPHFGSECPDCGQGERG